MKTDNRIYVPPHERVLVHRALVHVAELMRQAGDSYSTDARVVFGLRWTRNQLLDAAARFLPKAE